MNKIRLVMVVLLGIVGLAAGGCASVGIGGWGSTGPGGHDLTLVGVRLPNGSVVGHSHLHGGATGPVVQVVPPAALIDYWCLNVKRTDVGLGTPDPRINWYIRDLGDGITTFDQISFISSIGQDCKNFPAPTGVWLPLKEGNFKPY